MYLKLLSFFSFVTLVFHPRESLNLLFVHMMLSKEEKCQDTPVRHYFLGMEFFFLIKGQHICD